MTHRPYILESDIIDIRFLSFFHPSTYPYILIASQLIIQLVFPFFFAIFHSCYNDITNISYLSLYLVYLDYILIGSFDPHNAER